jgi:hypothetical protein
MKVHRRFPLIVVLREIDLDGFYPAGIGRSRCEAGNLEMLVAANSNQGPRYPRVGNEVLNPASLSWS